MTTRDIILAKLRSAKHCVSHAVVNKAAAVSPDPRAAKMTAGAGPASVVQSSARALEDREAQIRKFSQLAATSQMTVAPLAHVTELPAAVCRYLDAAQLPRRVVIDAHLDVAENLWGAASLIAAFGDTAADGDVYVRAGFAAIAECGAVVITSGSGRALRNDFLAQTHIVVVPRSRLLAGFSDLWALLRQEQQLAFIPREVCLVTGPSRTADLGVPAKLGAHGPARVHVLLAG